MLTRLLKGTSSNTCIELFRYTFVGGAAFLIDFGFLYILTDHAGLHYAISAAVAFTLGLTANYILSKLWVFSTSTIASRLTEFLVFALIGVVGLVINEILMILLTEVLLIYYLGSKIISTVIVYFWNFFGRKLILFR